MAESALHYAHEAGETDAVTRLIEQLIMPAWYSGRVATFESWLEWYDDDDAPALSDDRRARRLVLLPHRPARRKALAGSARRRRARRTPVLPDGSASIEPWIAALRTFTCPDGIETMLADAELTLEQLGPEGWWRPTAQLAAGVAHVLLGDPERGREALAVAAEMAAAAGASEEETAALAELAFVAIEAGAWEEAAIHAARAVASRREGRARRLHRERARACGHGAHRDPPRRRQAGARGRGADPSPAAAA